MMTTENLIPLVYSKPEIWDQNNLHYTSKEMKAKAWNYIADNLNSSADVVKTRWTNLRDLFRRELKKTLKMARETGDPDAYTPRWKHFKNMLFLKDQMVKDEDSGIPSLTFNDTFTIYPQTILEDGNKSDSLEDEYSVSSSQSHTDLSLLPASSDLSLVPASSDLPLVPPSSGKRSHENSNSNHEKQRSRKKKKKERAVVAEQNNVDHRNSSSAPPAPPPMPQIAEDYSHYQPAHYEMDEDYHFVMSILPSIRRINLDRKTTFKMKVLQLIIEEETYRPT